MTELGNNIHVLVVDDDDAIRDLLCDFLTEHGLSTDQAAHHTQLMQVLQQKVPDVLILDINMPQKNGMDICRELRAHPHYHQLPIVMLTARTGALDTIVGLETGADDYVAKPFEPLELLSRIRSVVRRSRMTKEHASHAVDKNHIRRIQFNQWQLDIVNRCLLDETQMTIPLSNAEFKFLRFMLLNANRILSRDQLMEAMHGREAGPFDRSIDLQISRLRQKIEVDVKQPNIFKTLRNEGYLLTADVRLLT